MSRYGLVNVNAGDEISSGSAGSAFDSDGVDFLVKFSEHVASVLKIADESGGVSGEDITGIAAAEGQNLLNFAIVLCVLIDYRAGDGAALALNAGELLNRRGFGQVIQILVIFNVQLVKNVHSVISFLLLVVGCWFIARHMDIIHQCYGKCKYLPPQC